MRKNSGSSGVAMGILLPMGLICLFAFCSLALALMGGRAYKSIQAGIDDSYGSTVAAGYLRTKLSQNNERGQVSIETEGPYEVLTIQSEQDDRFYITRIFVEEGELRESYTPTSTPFNPSSGVTIAKVNECRFELSEDGLFTAEILSENGVSTRTAFALAGGGGA
ncbi:DUF4860 domain-containing protein [Ruminococcaceae bacterium OttesenSCG-928-I18]|nr:DUF4860 domain-containing protein [Ruminococcaceae bacterium OttesenSCG-928-I18]